MTLTRRDLLRGAAGAAAGVPLARLPQLKKLKPGLGLPANAPIDTIVVVMMENRSFDHFLGWLPGADGAQEGLTYLDDAGLAHPTQYFGGGAGGRNDFAGCGFADPSHSWTGGRRQLGGTARDNSGFRKAPNDDFALSYYRSEDLPTWTAFSEQGTVFDRYFTALMSPTWPNREYMHAASSGGRKDNSFPPATGFPETTIWDRLDAAGVEWACYFSNLSFAALYGPRLFPKIRHISEYYARAAVGTLPQVCFVDPFLTVSEATGNDDHPHADIRNGQQFLADVSRAFGASPQWKRGALFVNYDEWGGFFDHVVPPRVVDDRASANLFEDFGQVGFRCPAVVLSPYAARGVVNHTTFEHTSILRFVEWRFQLAPLTGRDANTTNIGAGVFNFDARPNKADLEISAYKAPLEALIPCSARGHSAPVNDLEPLLEAGYFDAFKTDWKLEDSLLP